MDRLVKRYSGRPQASTPPDMVRSDALRIGACMADGETAAFPPMHAPNNSGSQERLLPTLVST